MDFSDALRLLKSGKQIQRAAWVRPGVTILVAMHNVDKFSPITIPFPVLVRHRTDYETDVTAYVMQPQDMLADDWQEVPILHTEA